MAKGIVISAVCARTSDGNEIAHRTETPPAPPKFQRKNMPENEKTRRSCGSFDGEQRLNGSFSAENRRDLGPVRRALDFYQPSEKSTPVGLGWPKINRRSAGVDFSLDFYQAGKNPARAERTLIFKNSNRAISPQI